MNERTWEWIVSCEHCGYKSRKHYKPIAYLLSWFHAFTRHPHGFNTIGATMTPGARARLKSYLKSRENEQVRRLLDNAQVGGKDDDAPAA